jgi:membrane protein
MHLRHLHLSRAHLGQHVPFARRARGSAEGGTRTSEGGVLEGAKRPASPRVAAPHVPRSPPRAPFHSEIVADRFRARPLDWIKCLWKRLTTNRSLGLGAEMAFWLFLSLLPLAAVAGLVAAKFATENWSATAPLLDSLPGATQQMLSSELGKVAAWNGGKVGIGAGLMFIWLASSGIHSVFDGIELETEAPPRPWWKKRLIALAACVALSVGVAILALLGTGLGWLWRFVGGATLFHTLQLESSVLGQMVRLVLGAAVSFGLISGLYWVALPPGVRKSMPIVPGALMAIGLQTAIGFVYGFYIKKAGDGSAYTAGLASIGITLMALYLFCTVLLIGIEVNQMLGDRRQALAPADLVPAH